MLIWITINIIAALLIIKRQKWKNIGLAEAMDIITLPQMWAINKLYDHLNNYGLMLVAVAVSLVTWPCNLILLAMIMLDVIAERI